MIRVDFEVLDFLLTIKHLPTFNAQYLAVGLLLDNVKPVYECGPFC